VNFCVEPKATLNEESTIFSVDYIKGIIKNRLKIAKFACNFYLFSLKITQLIEPIIFITFKRNDKMLKSS
jgi:hypothetical protein